MKIEKLIQTIKETNAGAIRRAIADNPRRVHIEREWAEYVAIGAQSYAPFKRTTTMVDDADYEGAILARECMS
jgi:hypothetical protein